MKNTLLLPHSFKWIGLILSAGFLALCIATFFYDYSSPLLATARVPHTNGGDDNLTDETAISGLIISLLMIGFSREQSEDEYVNAVRLQSFQIAFIAHYSLLVAGIFTVYGFNFLMVMFFSFPLLIFVFLVIFYWKLKVVPYLLKRRTA